MKLGRLAKLLLCLQQHEPTYKYALLNRTTFEPIKYRILFLYDVKIIVILLLRHSISLFSKYNIINIKMYQNMLVIIINYSQDFFLKSAFTSTLQLIC